MYASKNHSAFSLIKRKSAKGFTLLELMITVAIVGIALSIGIPSFSSIIKNNRQTTLLNEFTSYFHYAKSIAVTQGTFVTICPRNTAGTNCNSSAGWEEGWIVFIDKNQDVDVDGDDSLLKVHGAIKGDFTITSLSTGITITPRGFITTSSTFTFDDSEGNSFGTKTLSKTGRLF